MVTASNIFNRFRNTAVMSESYIEKYIRAKRNQEAGPKCLFGTPSDNEVNRYITEQNADQMSSNQEILDKYDLSDVSASDLLLDDSHSTTTSEQESTPSTSSFSFSSSDSGSENRFHPRVITRNNPAPAKNLFSPIDKVEVSSSRVLRTRHSEYWQTPKRRRSSSEKNIISTPDDISENSPVSSTSGCSSQLVNEDEQEEKTVEKTEETDEKEVKK